MPNAIIYVFTGTYHTLKTAQMIKTHLDAGNVTTSIYEVRQPIDQIPLPQDGDIVGFGYPIHAFNAPQLFLKFVKLLPTAQRNRAFIFKTSGEPFHINDASSWMLHRMLRKKGYDVALETHLLMPYNIMRRYPDGLVKQMTLYSDAQCKLLALRLLNGERDVIRYKLRHRFISALLLIEWFGAWFNGLFYSVNKQKCTGCQKCVKICPAANITHDGERFHFANHCTMCMRCAMYCPTDAMNIGLLQPWKVNGGYAFSKITDNPDISVDYVNPRTKGYFSLFLNFFRKADDSLAAYGIAVPGHIPFAKPEPPELEIFEACCAEQVAEYQQENQPEEHSQESDGVALP